MSPLDQLFARAEVASEVVPPCDPYLRARARLEVAVRECEAAEDEAYAHLNAAQDARERLGDWQLVMEELLYETERLRPSSPWVQS